MCVPYRSCLCFLLHLLSTAQRFLCSFVKKQGTTSFVFVRPELASFVEKFQRFSNDAYRYNVCSKQDRRNSGVTDVELFSGSRVNWLN